MGAPIFIEKSKPKVQFPFLSKSFGNAYCMLPGFNDVGDNNLLMKTFLYDDDSFKILVTDLFC